MHVHRLTLHLLGAGRQDISEKTHLKISLLVTRKREKEKREEGRRKGRQSVFNPRTFCVFHYYLILCICVPFKNAVTINATQR